MFKDLLIHLDASEHNARRVETGLALARGFGAQLSGLYVIPPDPVPLYAAGLPEGAAGAIVTAEVETVPNPFRERRDAVRSAFDALVADSGVPATWHEDSGPVAEVASVYARYADLTIVGQDSDEPAPGNTVPGLAAELLLQTGRPTLVLPYAEGWSTPGKRIAVGWAGTRESARALHDALPLLQRAEAVFLFTLRRDSDEAGATVPGQDPVRHLAHHGVEATWRRDETSLGIAEALLARASDQGCDLLVMGAYGHSRLRELIFGGVTRHVLQHMQVPVLMSS